MIPTTLGDIEPTATIPAQVKEVANSISEYIVEDEKWAGKCPVMHGGITKAGESNTSRLWPKSINLDILHQPDGFDLQRVRQLLFC